MNSNYGLLNAAVIRGLGISSVVLIALTLPEVNLGFIRIRVEEMLVPIAWFLMLIFALNSKKPFSDRFHCLCPDKISLSLLLLFIYMLIINIVSMLFYDLGNMSKLSSVLAYLWLYFTYTFFRFFFSSYSTKLNQYMIAFILLVPAIFSIEELFNIFGFAESIAQNYGLQHKIYRSLKRLGIEASGVFSSYDGASIYFGIISFSLFFYVYRSTNIYRIYFLIGVVIAFFSCLLSARTGGYLFIVFSMFLFLGGLSKSIMKANSYATALFSLVFIFSAVVVVINADVFLPEKTYERYIEPFQNYESSGEIKSTSTNHLHEMYNDLNGIVLNSIIIPASPYAFGHLIDAFYPKLVAGYGGLGLLLYLLVLFKLYNAVRVLRFSKDPMCSLIYCFSIAFILFDLVANFKGGDYLILQRWGDVYFILLAYALNHHEMDVKRKCFLLSCSK